MIARTGRSIRPPPLKREPNDAPQVTKYGSRQRERFSGWKGGAGLYSFMGYRGLFGLY
jgi:hypothetical protein